LTADEAFAHIQYLWETLKHSRAGLQIDRSGE